MPACSACGKSEAAVAQPHFSRALCKKCFLDDVVARARDVLERQYGAREGDTFLLAVSGGKDSFVLLDVMSKIFDPAKLVALTVVEGIPGYNRAEELEEMRKASKERGVEHVTITIKELFGASLAEIVERSRSAGFEASACTFCGVLRRRAINLAARQLGAGKVATAHVLDDEVQTAVINLLRGDPVRLLRQHPRAPKLSDKFVQRVKPLRRVYEWEAAMYAHISGYRFQEVECPFITSAPTLRARVRRWLYMLEREAPGSMLRALDAVDELAEALLAKYGKRLSELPSCKLCGEPTSFSRDVCKACELLSAVGLTP